MTTGDSEDSNESPRGFDFAYRSMAMHERVALARQSGKDTTTIERIKAKLLEDEEARRAGLQKNYQPSVTISPAKHVARAQTRDFKNLVNEFGSEVANQLGQPVFNPKYQHIWYRKDEVPLDADGNEREALWAKRHADGKFPCKRGCSICQKQRIVVAARQVDGMPASISEVLQAQADYYSKVPPGCEQLK